MNGRVCAINHGQGLVAIETEFHGFTIFELVDGGDVAVGDEIAWDSDLKVGADTYNNINTNRTLSVVVRNHLVSRSSLRQLLKM